MGNAFLNAWEMLSKIYFRNRSSTFGLVSIQHDRKKYVDKSRAAVGVRTSKVDIRECFVDGSANRQGKAGFAVYYSSGHKLNASSALRVDGEGRHNVAEIAACYAAVWRHPRDEPLVVYTDSFKALQSIERYVECEHLPDVPDPGPSLLVAIGVALQLRTASTSLVKIPAHCRIKRHDVADTLAKAARDSDRCILPMPPSNNWSHWKLGIEYLEECVRKKDEPLLAKTLKKKTALAVDCEMIEPRQNSKLDRTSTLASVSVVNDSGRQLYFSYVRRDPSHVKDYRSRISGVRPEHLSRNNPKADDFANVQNSVRKLIEGNILVGHDIGHDLSALGIEHPAHLVRDTSVLFSIFDSSYKRQKPGLRTLAKEHLGLTVQRKGRPHVPADDARAAMRLYLAHREQFDNAVENDAFAATPAATTTDDQDRDEKQQETVQKVSPPPRYGLVEKKSVFDVDDDRLLDRAPPRMTESSHDDDEIERDKAFVAS